MSKPNIKLTLQHSESVVAQCASQIYAAYIIAGKIEAGKEKEWMKRSIQEAIQIAVTTELAIQSDSELT
jgi:hypothetical protein